MGRFKERSRNIRRELSNSKAGQTPVKGKGKEKTVGASDSAADLEKR